MTADIVNLADWRGAHVKAETSPAIQRRLSGEAGVLDAAAWLALMWCLLLLLNEVGWVALG
jgi:hypothetical protein